MDNKLIKSIGEYAKKFSDAGFIESGYIAVREADGIAITAQKADLKSIGENDVVFVNDKNIESYEGNFRAAAVILFCAIRQDKTSEAAAIVDSDSILKYSSKRKPLQPVMDNVAKLMGVTVKCTSKNVAAEIVTSLSGYRNACFMPDAGAVVKARSLKELFAAVETLDKACNADMLAEDKGGTQHLNPVSAFIEQLVYKFTTRNENEVKPQAETEKEDNKAEGEPQTEEKPLDEKTAENSTETVEALTNEEAPANEEAPVSEEASANEDAPASENNLDNAEESSENVESAFGQPEQAETADGEAKQDNELSDNAEEKSECDAQSDTANNGAEEQADVEENCDCDTAQNGVQDENLSETWAVKKDGKFIGMACPKYVTAVCAIGKPMAVTDGFKHKLGEEISCLPSKMIFSNKSFEKALEATADMKICFMAQHGVIIKADSEQEFKETLKIVEAACKEYFCAD